MRARAAAPDTKGSRVAVVYKVVETSDVSAEELERILNQAIAELSVPLI